MIKRPWSDCNRRLISPSWKNQEKFHPATSWVINWSSQASNTLLKYKNYTSVNTMKNVILKDIENNTVFLKTKSGNVYLLCSVEIFSSNFMDYLYNLSPEEHSRIILECDFVLINSEWQKVSFLKSSELPKTITCWDGFSYWRNKKIKPIEKITVDTWGFFTNKTNEEIICSEFNVKSNRGAKEISLSLLDWNTKISFTTTSNKAYTIHKEWDIFILSNWKTRKKTKLNEKQISNTLKIWEPVYYWNWWNTEKIKTLNFSLLS